MPVYDFEAVEARHFSGVVFAKNQREAEGFIANESEDYVTDRSDVVIASLREVEPDCS